MTRTAESAPLRLCREFGPDWTATREYLRAGEAELAVLAPNGERGPAERTLAAAVHRRCRQARLAFLRLHADAVYAELTDGLRTRPDLDTIAYTAAERFPGLVPTRAQIAGERLSTQEDKEGLELDQGLLFWALFASPVSGTHLLHSVRRPTSLAEEMADRFGRTGHADLGRASVQRKGDVGHVTVHNERFLNAEDDEVVDALETAVDLVLLDDACKVGVLRGAVMSHHRYRGRRVFNAGINLTHLHQGQISFVDFLLRRETGYIAKMVRGLAADTSEDPGAHAEKPWIAAVDTFAIGGGMQIAIALDWVVADEDSYFSLPAMNEGIIPGAANFRLHRVLGARRSRQGVYGNRSFQAAGPDGSLLCDDVVPSAEVDEAVDAAARRLANPAAVANRRMLRLVEEPEEAFREYMAAYALEQSRLLYSDELIDNLKRMWIARSRSSA